jgi:Putative metallopeptidase
MSKRLLLIVVLSLALGAVTGAFSFSLLSQKRQAAALAAARAEGRAEAEKAVAAELAVLKPVVLTKATDADRKPGGTRFSYEYVKPKSADLESFYTLARDGDLLRKLPEIQAIDGLLMLPKPIKFVTAECREPNAFYSPERGEVVMCYETMKVLFERGKALAADQKLGDDYAQRYLRANLRFILLHETGHALIDLLEIPITGREEDAVDQLATTLMQRFAGMNESSIEVTDNLRMAANWFLVRSTGQYNLDAYADEHALGEQRYFNLQCLLYGSNPARYLSIVTSGDLPETRAKSCPAEARRVSKSWIRLLLPHVAPKFEMTEEKANRLFEQRERERNRNSEVPYVR